MTMRRVQLTEYLCSGRYTTRPLPNDEFTYVELTLLRTNEEEMEGKLMESKYFSSTEATGQISNVSQVRTEISLSYVILKRIYLILRNQRKLLMTDNKIEDSVQNNNTKFITVASSAI